MIMDDATVIGAAETLAEAITRSETYAGFMKAKENIKKEPSLAAQLDEYKDAYMDYRLNQSGGEAEDDKERVLSSQYSALMLMDKTRDYLECEARLYALIDKVHGALQKAYENI